MEIAARRPSKRVWGVFLAFAAICLAGLLMTPLTAYADEKNPVPAEDCRDYVGILVDSYARDEWGCAGSILDVIGPNAVYDYSSGGAVYTGSQSWTVCRDGRVVAFVFSVETEEGNTFTLSTDISDALAPTDLADKPEQISFIEQSDELYCIDTESDKAYEVGISADAAVCKEASSLPEEAFAGVRSAVSAPVACSVKASSVTVTSSKNLNVPHVFQGSKPICWAASTCQVGRYLTGITRVTPEDIAYAIKGSDNKSGNLDDIVRAYKFFVYPGSSTSISAIKTRDDAAKRFSDSAIRTWINSGIPVHIGTISNTGSGHAVIIDGYKTYSSGATALRIVNPGSNSEKYIYATKSAGYYQFRFVATGGAHTFKWKDQTVLLTGWQKPFGGSTWSYMNSNGTKTYGWKSIGGSWYYFNGSGAMATGWQSVGGKWYYLNSSGVMQTGWLKTGGQWYYLNSDGSMVTGWKKVDGKWYAFDTSGAMRKGWFKDGAYWYYLRTASNTPSGGQEGSMLANGSWNIGGKVYRFDANGHCLNP